MKTFTLVLVAAGMTMISFAQSDNEVVCPTIVPTNPNNSSNSAEIIFYDYDMNVLATCTCNHAGIGDGTEGRYNCGTCMPSSWSFAQIDSENPCVNPNTLPVTLSDFAAVKRAGYNELFWITLSEQNNDYFHLEATTDGIHYRSVQLVRGSGNSSIRQIYTVKDAQPTAGINYYRLTQVDFDGKSQTYPPIAIDNSDLLKELVRRINIQGQEVDENYRGLVIEHYTDGSVLKRMMEN